MIKKSYNRILEISDDHKQITLPDSRYYRRNGEYYPSITYVLNSYPKGKHFQEWLKKVGYSADWIVKKASEEGTKVHEMIEKYFEGKELTYLNKEGYPKMDPLVWQMFLRFVDFWETSKAELVETEVFLYSDNLNIAGTCDLVCKIDDKVCVIDIKTSNHLQITYDLQSAVYARCFEECYDTKVDRVGILWLKSSKRSYKEGKLQGKGWEVFESPRSMDENLEIFSHVRALFDLENPSLKPISEKWPTSVHKQ
mgnify:CR=1 FL=1